MKMIFLVENLILHKQSFCVVCGKKTKSLYVFLEKCSVTNTSVLHQHNSLTGKQIGFTWPLNNKKKTLSAFSLLFTSKRRAQRSGFTETQFLTISNPKIYLQRTEARVSPDEHLRIFVRTYQNIHCCRSTHGFHFQSVIIKHYFRRTHFIRLTVLLVQKIYDFTFHFYFYVTSKNCFSKILLFENRLCFFVHFVCLNNAVSNLKRALENPLPQIGSKIKPKS